MRQAHLAPDLFSPSVRIAFLAAKAAWSRARRRWPRRGSSRVECLAWWRRSGWAAGVAHGIRGADRAVPGRPTAAPLPKCIPRC